MRKRLNVCARVLLRRRKRWEVRHAERVVSVSVSVSLSLYVRVCASVNLSLSLSLSLVSLSLVSLALSLSLSLGVELPWARWKGKVPTEIVCLRCSTFPDQDSAESCFASSVW